MPRPIQTLHLADALTRVFRLSGKAKLEADEQVIATVGIGLEDVPFVADGRHYFAAYMYMAANVGFSSHCFLINPAPGDGVLICDRFIAHCTDQELAVGFTSSSSAAGSRVYSTTVPWRADVAGIRQLPPLVAGNNTAGPFGTAMLLLPPSCPTVGGGMYMYDVKGPFVLPGRVAREELVVRSNTANRILTVNFFGRWYAGLKASELL